MNGAGDVVIVVLTVAYTFPNLSQLLLSHRRSIYDLGSSGDLVEDGKGYWQVGVVECETDRSQQRNRHSPSLALSVLLPKLLPKTKKSLSGFG